jgi:hypothetical protein
MRQSGAKKERAPAAVVHASHTWGLEAWTSTETLMLRSDAKAVLRVLMVEGDS